MPWAARVSVINARASSPVGAEDGVRDAFPDLVSGGRETTNTASRSVRSLHRDANLSMIPLRGRDGWVKRAPAVKGTAAVARFDNHRLPGARLA
jgi:hypothetical protein